MCLFFIYIVVVKRGGKLRRLFSLWSNLGYVNVTNKHLKCFQESAFNHSEIIRLEEILLWRLLNEL